jgi:N-methylhydantoinase B
MECQQKSYKIFLRGPRFCGDAQFVEQLSRAFAKVFALSRGTLASMRADPIELEVFKHLFHSIADEMGAALRRTAFSPNIKERRDYSCALFDAAGEALAMGDHMPVHLGSMPMSVRAAMDELALGPGDVAMLNDPFRGGTHLPDITVVAPVFVGGRAGAKHSKRAGAPDFYVAARAHHADVGGTYAGSMGPCREIYQEGFRIPPVKIVRGGEVDRDVLALLLNNVRTPEEREGDLRAQLAACHTGSSRVNELVEKYGLPRVRRAGTALLDYSAEMMKAFLATVPAGSYAAEDFLDDDGVSDAPVRIAVRITFPRSRAKRVVVDFTGSSPQVEGSVNAVEAITFSACFYVFRCLLREDVPATAGLMRPIQVVAPAGTVVNAKPPAAVAGGNVETSQRVVDVLLRALAQALPDRIPAASSGTMNNLTIGGMDARSGAPAPFAYYETIAGGSGASALGDGVSGVHTHMTNSLNTPAEALEYSYPLRVTKYSLRPRSGGEGQHRGGDGIVREIEVLTDATVTLLSDRRQTRPYGLNGGGDGAPGKTVVARADGSEEELPGKTSTGLKRGERVRVETPGGGGWGGPASEH